MSAVHDVLQPETSAIYRAVGQEGDERWLCSAQMNRQQAVPTSDAAWIDLATLPRLADVPLRQHVANLQYLRRIRLAAAGAALRTGRHATRTPALAGSAQMRGCAGHGTSSGSRERALRVASLIAECEHRPKKGQLPRRRNSTSRSAIAATSSPSSTCAR